MILPDPDQVPAWVPWVIVLGMVVAFGLLNTWLPS